MKSKTVTFKNKNNDTLKGKIELPVDQHAHSFALFAHCFTCSKNLKAVKNISKALTAEGFGVLRFDFTGLGQSEGDFEDTNFSHNVSDLIDAAEYLEQNYCAPALLIGHSLGGAAVIQAASMLNHIKAIATIGSPYEPKHVQKLLKDDIETIRQKGEAKVDLGGRTFTIKKQFLDDLENQTNASILKNLKKPLLIMHSPQDATVNIENAEKLYRDAFHPKSFISLDGADHLLMNNDADATYVGNSIAAWATRYLSMEEKNRIPDAHEKVVGVLDADDTFTTDLKLGNHYVKADEPEDIGGNDFGPNPFEFVSGGLAACTAMTIKMYSNRKEWDVQQIKVFVDHYKESRQDDKGKTQKVDIFKRDITLEGDLDEKQRQRLIEIANKCPVHRTLHNDVVVLTQERTEA
ncbi:MAG: alpha/beta fold hydrolase [Psychroflexus sp.]|jgi:putative redox protein|nr:alpha/beta fold hydrolase [Psychroflexus sp.]MDR9448281.1 alpha/beta fold hydrolase [Psychroflexus sp.]